MAVINTMTEKNLARKGFSFILQFVVHHPRKSEQELKQGWSLTVRVMEECCFLSCFSWLVQSASSEHPGPPVWG